MDIKVSILEYLGKVETSIIVLISLVYNNKYYEGIFIYNDEKISLSIDDNLEKEIGPIKEYKEYVDILRFLLKSVSPWSEIINTINDFDFNKFQPKTSEKVYIAANVNPNDVSIFKT